MSTIISLREQLAKAAEERKARIAAEEAAKATATPVVTPVVAKPKEEPRPRDLSLEMGADEIITELSKELSGKLPESLEKALEAMPELKAVVEEVFTATSGMREAVNKRYVRLHDSTVKRQTIAAFKEEIGGNFADRLPYRLWERLVAFKAAEALTDERAAAIVAANKAVDEQRAKDKTGGRKVFVHESRDRGATHHYLPTAPWLEHALYDRYRVIGSARKAWRDTIQTLNISEGGDMKDALLDIASGAQGAIVAYLPYPKDGEEKITVSGRVVHGRFIVQVIEPNGDIPQLVIEPFEEAASPMYVALHQFFPPAVFEFKPLRDRKKPWLAFDGLQEKSGKPAGLIRKILMRTLGVQERKHDDRGGNRVAYTSGPTSHRPDMAVEFNKPKLPVEAPTEAPAPAPPAESRKVRRAGKQAAQQTEGTPTGRPAAKPRGGAGSDEGSRAMRGEISTE